MTIGLIKGIYNNKEFMNLYVPVPLYSTIPRNKINWCQWCKNFYHWNNVSLKLHGFYYENKTEKMYSLILRKKKR